MLTRKTVFSPIYVREHKKPVPYTIKHYQTELAAAMQSPGTMLTSLSQKHDDGTIKRQKRADGQFNLSQVFHAMLDDMDLESLVWGQPYRDKDGQPRFFTHGIDWLVEKLHMNYETVKRHLLAAAEAGYLVIDRRRGYDKNGKKITLFSLRSFTFKFFYELDGGKQLLAVKNYLKQKKSALNMEKLKQVKEGIVKHKNTAVKNVKKFLGISRKEEDAKRNMADDALRIAHETNRSVIDVMRELQNPR